MKQISFCITCMNRLKHLQETLEKNILDNFLVDEVEFVVLDYNSQDGLEEWIAQSMMKYIEMGILVYYRTTEPAYYRRSHSRNMVFRLAEGEVVCNLDADNYLGRGFAEFMLKEFNNKERLFYTSNLCYRDVFGRVCLERKEFVEARGYNEVFVGYGLEDVEFFNRLLCRGLVQEIFNQKEFYNVLMHADEERIAQEFLLKKLQSVYLDYINPYSTRVLMLYKGQRFGIGVIQNNIAMNYNHPDESDMLKQCIGDKYRLVIKGEWKEGIWDEMENGIRLNFKDEEMILRNKSNCLYDFNHQYYKVKDANLIVVIVMGVTEAINYLKMKKMDNDCKTVCCTAQRVHYCRRPCGAPPRKKGLLPDGSGGVFPEKDEGLRRSDPGTHRHAAPSLHGALPLAASPGIPVLHVADRHRDCHPVWLSQFVHHGLSVPERIRDDPGHVSPSTPSAKLQRTICVVKWIWLYASVFHSLYFDTPSFF